MSPVPCVSTMIVLLPSSPPILRAATPEELPPVSSTMTRQTPTQTDFYQTRETHEPWPFPLSTPKRPKRPGLDSSVPSDELFDRLMSYSYYCLMKTRPIRTRQPTTLLHKTLRNIDLTVRDHKFSGGDPLLVFDFLIRVVEGVDKLVMSERQLIVCFPQLLINNAAQNFRSASSHSRFGGLVCSQAAVQYFLRTYATE